MGDRGRLLRIAFLAGAVTDALAIFPMLSPTMAGFVWGFEDTTPAYSFAMGYGASLMAGWTALLVWAYQRPIERQVIAALTILVIGGLVITEILSVASGQLAARQMALTWILQAALIVLFASAFMAQLRAAGRQ